METCYHLPLALLICVTTTIGENKAMSFSMWSASLTLAFLVPIGRASAETLKFGGVRKVTAEVDRMDEKYRLQVRFLPVHSLSAGTNLKINLAKGRNYSLRALACHLDLGKTAHLTVSQMRIASNEPDGRFLRIAYTIPVDSVTVNTLPGDGNRVSTEGLALEANSSDQKHNLRFRSLTRGALDLLARVPDYQNTIEALGDSWDAILTKETPDGRQMQDVADADCWNMVQEIDNDPLLLDHDKQELNKQLLNEFRSFVTSLLNRDERSIGLPSTG